MNYHHHYFTYRLNQEAREVYWHSFLNSVALSLVFIFEPIFLYTRGYQLTQIMWFYVQVYVWYAILISVGAKFASHYGYKHSIFLSNIFYVVYWILLLSIQNHPSLFYLAPVFFALQKSWFWPAYDADIALSSPPIQRGREIGALFSIIQLGLIIGPFVGGFISDSFGFAALFVAASVLMLFSAYPLFKSPDIHARHSFRLKNLWAVFKAHKINFFGYWGYAEDLMVMSLWPIFIFIAVSDFFEVGVISTIGAVIGTMIMLYIGKLTDRTDKRKLIRLSSLFYGVTWLFRFLSHGTVSVLGFDALTKAGKDTLNVPMVSLTFDHAAKRGPDYAIAYSVFYEFSLSIGKIVTALLAIAILGAGLSIFWVFAMAGILTMLYGLLK
ncbi:MAG: MFS transporter [bacterium]|nr:MFS transporter [bacterium]